MSSTCFCRLIPLGLCYFLVLFHASLAQLPFQTHTHQSSRLTGLPDCQLRKITARQPNRRQVSEAGFTEFWDSGPKDELECAGVQVVRHTINPKGLLLPYYPNSPELVYVVRGQGIQGTVLPGCQETVQTPFSSEDGSERFLDRYQSVYRYKEGDILALPVGAVHWTYNDGDKPIVLVALRDTSNVANQLDRNFKKFFVAGNPQSQVQQGEPWGIPAQRQEPRSGNGGRPRQPQQEQEGFNMFAGFGGNILEEIFNVEHEIVRQLKGLNDDRGLIVLAENFKVLLPDQQYSSRGRGGDNGVEQTICSTQLSATISSPVSADVYNPRGGRITRLNSHKLPVLKAFQLSAERGVLYKNAILAPHFNLNAHSIIYIISGSSRLQIVGNEGVAVFDDEMEGGQLVVVPQGFPVIMKAGEEGCEWVAFKTNDNAITAQLAGRLSYMRAVPEGVLANAYDISPENVKKLKYNREEGVILSPSSGSGSRSRSRSGSSIEKVKNAMLHAVFG